MIIDLQRRIAEIGRIRIGQQVSNGRSKRPSKLGTFRLTSADRNRIHQAAMLYGGQPSEWEAPAGNQWEVITEADALAVIVPPSDMAFSQHYEMWSAGGCQRRCDGNTESISDGPCVCDPDKRECAIHTRLSVMLRDLPGLGVWRIDTSGYYAAVELQGAVEVIQMAAGRGQMLPAQLRLEQRMVKRGGQTRRFAVPVLDVEISPAQLIGGNTQIPQLSDPGVVAIEAPRPAVVDGARALAAPSPLTPVPETVPEHPVASIKEQATAVKERRKSSQQAIPSTGLKPRTAAQAASNSVAKPEPAQVEAPPDPAADEPEGPATRSQNTEINRMFKAATVTDKDAKRTVVCHILGYDVGALTESEAAQLIRKLNDWNNDGALTDKVWAIIDPPEPAAPPPSDDEPLTDPQKTKLAIIREERYPKTIKGRGDWFAWIAKHINREVSSNTELTKAEAMVILDLLEGTEDAEEVTAPEESE